MDEVCPVNGSAGHKLYNHMGQPSGEEIFSQKIHPVERDPNLEVCTKLLIS